MWKMNLMETTELTDIIDTLVEEIIETLAEETVSKYYALETNEEREEAQSLNTSFGICS